MAHQEAKYYSPEDVVYIEREEGTSALIHLFGGTLLSWKCRGRENLYLSQTSVDTFQKKTHIRGGVPLVFPHFGAWDLGPLHGFSRVKPWTLVSKNKDANGDVTAVVQLVDDEETRTMWNFQFQMKYTLTLKKDELISEMAILNNGNQSFDFNFGYHTYFKVADVETTTISGLKDIKYLNILDNKKEEVEKEGEVRLSQESARIYKNVASVNVKSGPDPVRNIELVSQNMNDMVVWNPWEKTGASLPDLDENGYRQFICVEAGIVAEKQTLEPSHVINATQKFRVVQ